MRRTALTLVKLLTIAVLILAASPASAYCRTHTYFINGIYITCTTCCFGYYCNTTCY